MKASTFPIAYELEYQQPQDGLEKEGIFFPSYHGNKDFPLATTNQAPYQRVSKIRTTYSEVNYSTLSSAVCKSKRTNQVGAAACFETFKSLKVLSVVTAHLMADN